MNSQSNNSESDNSTPTPIRIFKQFSSLPYQTITDTGEIVAVNDIWLETYGYDRSDVIGTKFESLLALESIETFRSALQSLKSEGSIHDVELEVNTNDGSSIFVSLHGQVEYEENVRRMHCLFRDITDQRNTEQELRNERDRFRALTGAIPDVVIRYNSEGVYKEILTGQTQLLVSSEDKLLGTSIWDQLNPDAAEKIQSAIDETLEKGTVTRTEHPLQIDETKKWFEAQVAPLSNESNEVVLISRDITDRKEQEKELRRTKERFELAIEGANLGVWDWDMNTDAVSRHAKLREMLGYSAGKFSGRLEDWEQIVHPDDKKVHDEALETHITEDTEYYQCDYRLQTNSGDWKWIRNIGKIVKWNPDGTPARAVGIHIDIDKQKRTMQELEQKTEQLEALNRVVRHDIRNDMNIISGWAQELENQVEGDGKLAVERVLEVSNRVMDITRVAREFIDTLGGEETVELGAVSLDKHLLNEVETKRETYPDTSIQIVGEIPSVTVRANEMISSVFRNLLVNAIQHNTSSNPEVIINVAEQSEEVLVSVADNGPGIPDDRKEEVFGKGEKGIESEGTGIGLHLVHSLVTGYGGEVWIEDNEPQGTVFKVELQKAD